MADAAGLPFPKKTQNKRQKPTRKKVNRERGAEKRSERADRRGSLRTQAVERSGGECEWSGCESAAAHMAHLQGIGRGGDPLGLRDTLENVAMLCVYHHDLLDGRQVMRYKEIEALFTEVLELRSVVQDGGGV